jgi:hypothetical protein
MDTPTMQALHILRIGGSGTRDEIVAAVGVETVDQLTSEELVATAGTRLRLTDAGRARHEGSLARELNERNCRPAVEGCYRDFLPLNANVLQICTDWQLRVDGGVPVPNDHSDADYDADVISRLTETYDCVQPVLHDLATALPRYSSYADDLAHALGRVQAGETDYVTNPRVRCFHTVWFELHEDLLATLGIERADEDAAVTAR